MERYDGKTRKDDIKKYTLIGLAVVVVLVGFFLLQHFFGTKDPDPDYTVLYAGDYSLSDSASEYMAEYIGEIVGDLNGDGTVLVDVISISVNPEDYGTSTTMFQYLAIQMANEDVQLVFLTDEPEEALGFEGLSSNYCGQDGYFAELPEELADEKYSNRCRVDQTELFQNLGYSSVPEVYAHVLDGNHDEEEAMAFAQSVIEAIAADTAED